MDIHTQLPVSPAEIRQASKIQSKKQLKNHQVKKQSQYGKFDKDILQGNNP